MATQVQFRGGTTSEHSSFNGAAREVTVDTTKQTLVVQDGSTNGGYPLLREKNPDEQGLFFGGGDDLQLYHSDPHSYIKHQNENGKLKILSGASGNGGITLLDRVNSDVYIDCSHNGSVQLNWDNASKLYTESSGVAINGDLSIENNGHIRIRNTGDNSSTQIQLSNDGTASFAGVVTFSNHIDLGDDNIIKLGTHNDLEIYYNNGGSDARIVNTNTSGWLSLRGDAIKIGSYTDTEDYIVCSHNGGVQLYFNDVKHFETNGGGCVSNKAGANTFSLGSTDAGGVYLVLDGDSNGDASGSDYVTLAHGTDGDFSIQCDNPAGDSQFELYVGSGSTTAMIAQAAGEVQLSHNGTQKFATKSNGIAVTGRASFSGGTDLESQSMYLSGGSSNATQIGMFNGHSKEQGFCFYNNGSSANKSWGMITDQQNWFIKQAAYNIGNASDLTTDWTSRVKVENGGTMTLMTGHLKFGTVDYGIHFGVNDDTGRTVNSNVLHDYEEGTWTPLITSDDSNAFTSVNNNSTGRYTKVGNLVTVHCMHMTAAVNKGSASDSSHVLIGGLPYTSSSNMTDAMVTLGFNVNWSSYPNTARITSSTDKIQLYKHADSASNNTGTKMTVGGIATGSNANYCRFTLTYMVDD